MVKKHQSPTFLIIEEWLLPILVLIIFCAAYFCSGYDSDQDYYARIDHLLGTTVTLLTNSSAIPIVTGAVDEAWLIKTEANFYSAAVKLADQNNNYAWSTYQKSRKLTPVYAAHQLTSLSEAKKGEGETALFLDEISGRKYQQEEQRFQKEQFFRNFKKGLGSADIYVDNIGILSDQLLKDLFTIELPDLPEADTKDFAKALPVLKIEPLENWQKNIQDKLSEPPDLGEKLGSFWQIQLEILEGHFTRINNSLLKIQDNTPLLFGLKISDPSGSNVTNLSGLKNYLPYLTTLPLPEEENSRLKLVTTEDQSHANNHISSAENIPESGIKLVSQELGNVVPVQSPLVINYSAAPDVENVELSVKDGSGQEIYDYQEPRPNPSDPLPLIWNGTCLNSAHFEDGQLAPPGNYSFSLTGHDTAGQVHLTPPYLIRVVEKLQQNIKTLRAFAINNNGSGEYFSYLTFNLHNTLGYGLEKIYVWLHGSETDLLKKPISTALYLSFARFIPEKSTLSVLGNPEISVNNSKPIFIRLVDQDNRPIINAPVTLYSRRNRNNTIDRFNPTTARTNGEGVARIDFSSRFAGDAELFALSDLLWVNNKPLVIKVKPGLTEE